MSKRPWTAVLSALWDLLPGSFPPFIFFRHVENPYAFAGFCAWIGFCTVGMFDYTLGMSAAVKTLLFMTGCCLRLETSLGNKEEKTL